MRTNISDPSIKLTFVKKKSMPNLVETIGYVKCYSSSNPTPIKNPGNSIRYDCQNVIINPIIYMFFKRVY